MAVYILRSGENGPAKIGFTTDLPGRLKYYKIHNPDVLQVVRHLEGTKADEKRLHQRFAALRIKGEWFNFHHDMMGDLGLPDAIVIPVPVPSLTPVQTLIKTAGGAKAFAEKLNVEHATVRGWNFLGFIPGNRLPDISRTTGIKLEKLTALMKPPRKRAA